MKLNKLIVSDLSYGSILPSAIIVYIIIFSGFEVVGKEDFFRSLSDSLLDDWPTLLFYLSFPYAYVLKNYLEKKYE